MLIVASIMAKRSAITTCIPRRVRLPDHLHVPLFVRHPDVSPGVADEVVSTRDLFG